VSERERERERYGDAGGSGGAAEFSEQRRFVVVFAYVYESLCEEVSDSDFLVLSQSDS
jgi:hypothetical protein